MKAHSEFGGLSLPTGLAYLPSRKGRIIASTPFEQDGPDRNPDPLPGGKAIRRSRTGRLMDKPTIPSYVFPEVPHHRGTVV
jgi:hypothetical protein